MCRAFDTCRCVGISTPLDGGVEISTPLDVGVGISTPLGAGYPRGVEISTLLDAGHALMGGARVPPSRRAGVGAAGLVEATGLTWRQIRYLERAKYIAPDVKRKNSRYGRYSMEAVEKIRHEIVPGLRAANLIPPPGVDPENAEMPGSPPGMPMGAPPIPVILAEHRSASPPVYGGGRPSYAPPPPPPGPTRDFAGGSPPNVPQPAAPGSPPYSYAPYPYAPYPYPPFWPPWWGPAPSGPAPSPMPGPPQVSPAPAYVAPQAMPAPTPGGPTGGQRRWFPCVACRGTGVIAGARCPVCSGLRVMMGRRAPCEACWGRGFLISHRGVATCSICGGSRFMVVP